MKRYFYTDPIAAACMAKHHGFDIHGPVRKLGGEIGESIQPMPVWILARAIEAHDRGLGPEGAKYYVNSNSLHLLEPKAGDLCESKNGIPELCEAPASEKEIGGNVMSVIVLDGSYRMRSDIKRIIQRNGLAFMWPESEEE